MIEAKDRNSKVEQVKENFPSGVCPPYMVLLCSKCFVQRWNNLGKSFMRLFLLFVSLRILCGSQSTYILCCILHNNYVPATGIFEKIGVKCQNLGHVENWLFRSRRLLLSPLILLMLAFDVIGVQLQHTKWLPSFWCLAVCFPLSFQQFDQETCPKFCCHLR